jgi:hypothetical protein
MPHVVIVADGRFTRQSSILIRSIHAAISAELLTILDHPCSMRS